MKYTVERIVCGNGIAKYIVIIEKDGVILRSVISEYEMLVTKQ